MNVESSPSLNIEHLVIEHFFWWVSFLDPPYVFIKVCRPPRA